MQPWPSHSSTFISRSWGYDSGHPLLNLHTGFILGIALQPLDTPNPSVWNLVPGSGSPGILPFRVGLWVSLSYRVCLSVLALYSLWWCASPSSPSQPLEWQSTGLVQVSRGSWSRSLTWMTYQAIKVPLPLRLCLCVTTVFKQLPSEYCYL